MKKIQCVIFDFGGVIGKPQDDRYVEDMAELVGIEKEKWLSAYFTHRGAYDGGVTDSWQYWEKVVEGHDVTLTDELVSSLVEADFKSWTQINEQTIQWIHELSKENVTLILLSNINHGVLEHVKNAFDWLDDFDQVFYSCEMGMLKPNEEIYQEVLKAIHEPADKCLFIDDSMHNVEGAIHVGMESVRFTTFDETRAYIEKHYDIEGQDIEDVIDMI